MINHQSSMVNKTKVVFFGAGPYVSPIINTLRRELDITLSISSDQKIDDHLINQLKTSGAKVAVLASFGQIVPQRVLDSFEYGILNIHPSLLPKFRGPTPVQSAILAGVEKTGVSIIKLDDKVDHGPVLAQIEEKIESNDTSETLYRRLFQKGAELLLQVLPKYISGELKPVEQDHSNATFTQHLTRQSGLIDLDHEPRATSQQLNRMIRAYYPWPGVWFRAKLNGVERIVKLFPNQKIQVEGKKIMTFRDFLNGYPEGERILQKLNLS